MGKNYVNEYLNDDNVPERNKELFQWMITKLKGIGYSEERILEISGYKEFKEILINLKPNTKGLIWNYMYIIGHYIRWCIDNGCCDNKQLYQITESINADEIWRIIKPNTPNKFINEIQYRQLINIITQNEDLNTLYYVTLFQAIYEGIYGTDLYEISEIRASDVEDNIVTIRHRDKTETKLKISDELASNLIKLSMCDKWERIGNKDVISSSNVQGKYKDSCFKTVIRNDCFDDDLSRKNFYYQKIRKIHKKYLGFRLNAKDIYHSGIINRVIKQMESNNLDIKKYLGNYGQNSKVTEIFTNELQRVNCKLKPEYFKNRMVDYIDIIMSRTEL